jgi:hypothetical protein
MARDGGRRNAPVPGSIGRPNDHGQPLLPLGRAACRCGTTHVAPSCSRTSSSCATLQRVSDVEDCKILTCHVNGDVVHRNGADGAASRTVMCVPVDDELGSMHPDRPR